MNTILLVLSLLFGMLFILQMKKKEFVSVAILTSRIFIGIVFMYSGFVKAVDPLGSTYKFVDYFVAFDFPPMEELNFMLAIFLSSIEFIIGFGFISGTFLRFSTWLGALFMLAFTPLTLYLAINNPVTDCGCFGDALILTNWQTFWKNIIIDIPIIILIIQKEKLYNFFEGKTAVVLSSIIFIAISYISIYGYHHLPIMDFRAFKIGNNISEGMQMPKGAKHDVYQTTFSYKNTETQDIVEFAEDNLEEPLSNDTKWEFIDSQSILTEEGYHPPIHDFSIVNETEGDITEQILNDSNYTLILISYDLNKCNYETLIKYEKLSKYFSNSATTTIALTAALKNEITTITKKLKASLNYNSSPNKDVKITKIYYYEHDGNILEFIEEERPNNLDDSYILVDEEEIEIEQNTEAALSFGFYICDPITLKTIVRSNPGLILIKKGTVINKWHYNDFPSIEDLEKIIS